MRMILLTIGSALLASTALAAPQTIDPKGLEFFENKVRPALIKYCYECHSRDAGKAKGSLYLDTREGSQRGGDSGPAIVPGKPYESLLIKSIRHEGDLKMPPKTRLPENVIRDLVTWIEMGAPDPRDGIGSLRRVTLKDYQDWWSFKPLAKTVPPKTKNTGWSTSPIDQFVLAKHEEKGLKPVLDATPEALLRRVYFDLIGLPPSPSDIDTFLTNHKKDPRKAIETVVDKLLASPHFGERWGRYWLDLARYAESNGNADNTPFPNAYRYRDYVIKSLNQDKPYDQFIREQVAGDLLPAQTKEERDDLLVATGFLALTSKPRAQNNPDFRYDLLADQIDVTTRGVLALSVLCARCHDHKFDPIPTLEYYSLAGIFDSSEMLAGGGVRGGGTGKRANGGGGLHSLGSGGEAMGVREGRVGDMQIAVRGEANNLGAKAPRGLLTAVTVGAAPEMPKNNSGRLELANWLTESKNPLTARVAVNRIWQHLFGRGIVPTTDNFGVLGEMPTHPELLDYLAAQFVQQGWSTKKMIRTLVLTRSYQLSSAHQASNVATDPDNTWFWRMNRRRLDAEAMRDSVLQVGGKLNLEPLKGTTMTAANVGKKPRPSSTEVGHRSVYLGIVRGAPLPEALAIFDVANPNIIVPEREVTTVPSQALYLMNSPWVAEQSVNFANRLLAEASLSDADRVQLAYRLAYGRVPAKPEVDRSLAFLQVELKDKDGNPKKAWASLCQAIFASAEFRYVQ